MATYIEVEDLIVDEIYNIYDTTIGYETKGLEAITLKLMEEVGELAEQVNVRQGHLPNKVLKEPIEGEVADVLNCVFCILFKAYPDKNVFEILGLLGKQMNVKNQKWRNHYGSIA